MIRCHWVRRSGTVETGRICLVAQCLGPMALAGRTYRGLNRLDGPLSRLTRNLIQFGLGGSEIRVPLALPVFGLGTLAGAFDYSGVQIQSALSSSMAPAICSFKATAVKHWTYWKSASVSSQLAGVFSCQIVTVGRVFVLFDRSTPQRKNH
jgi:hypothetical protein